VQLISVEKSGKMHKVPTFCVSREVVNMRMPLMHNRTFGILAFVLVTWVMQGCSMIQSVEPWQKGNLAKPEMTFDNDPLEAGYKEHIYSSKEASSGGSGVGGGGCGCN